MLIMNGDSFTDADLCAFFDRHGVANAIGKPAKRELLPKRPIDVLETFADSSDLERAISFAPRTPIEDGLSSFVAWFRRCHRRDK